MLLNRNRYDTFYKKFNQQVKDYLTKNLKVKMETSEDWGGTFVITKLILGTEVISESYVKVNDLSLSRR